MTQDLTTNKCLTCIPSHIFNIATTACESTLSAINIGCNGICTIGTAKYIAAVGPVAAHLEAATCGKGFTYDSTLNRCTRNKADYPLTLLDIDANSGNV